VTFGWRRQPDRNLRSAWDIAGKSAKIGLKMSQNKAGQISQKVIRRMRRFYGINAVFRYRNDLEKIENFVQTLLDGKEADSLLQVEGGEENHNRLWFRGESLNRRKQRIYPVSCSEPAPHYRLLW
jgi:hypothetical protein